MAQRLQCALRRSSVFLSGQLSVYFLQSFHGFVMNQALNNALKHIAAAIRLHSTSAAELLRLGAIFTSLGLVRPYPFTQPHEVLS